jgi:hypothetical protein
MILNPPFRDLFIDTLRHCVAQGGGKWLGIQDAVFPDMFPVLTFTHPETGDLSAIRIDPINFEQRELVSQVKGIIAAGTKRAEGRIVKVPVAVLRELAVKLLKLSEEISALYEEKQ